MQISITVEGKTTKDFASSLRKFANALDGGESTTGPAEETTHIDVGAMKRKAGRPSKIIHEAEEEEPLDLGDTETEEDESEESNEADDDTETEEDDAPPAKKAKSEKAAPEYTLESHIIPAFQRYSKATSREQAGKVLKKFGVKSVRDLPKAKYAEVLRALAVKK